MARRREALRVALVGVNSPGYRSLATAYLKAAAAAEPRLDVALMRLDFDASVDPWWIAYRLLTLDPAPDVVALPVMCWTARSVYELARILKQARPGLFVIVGGPEVGPIAEEVLSAQPAIDAVVRGEGEVTFPELLIAIDRGGDPCAVPGVSARDRGEVVSGPDREAVGELDTLPSPFSDTSWVPVDGSAYIETYRGCPHRCSYCFEGKGSTRIRSFSWERMAADVAAVTSVPGLRSYSFIDPVFNLTPDRLSRLADICEPHARRGVRLHTIEVDIERIDDAAARELVRAGVASVETGPQSVGAAALSECRRSFDADRFAAGVEACKRAGIAVECDLIIGLPGDTVDDVVRGFEFVTSLDPAVLQVSTLHVLPGTDLWARAGDLGLIFDPEPPHELIATRDIGYADLRRLEVHGVALGAQLRAANR